MIRHTRRPSATTTQINQPINESINHLRPRYGATKVKRGATVTYDEWVELACEVVKSEAAKAPDRPIILYGLSAGGMLAYHVAARIPGLVKGIVGMTFLDQRLQVHEMHQRRGLLSEHSCNCSPVRPTQPTRN